MADLKTYSVLIRWDDNDLEQGEFGTMVRAANSEEAERLARIDMRKCHIDNHGEEGVEYYEDADGEFGGSVIEVTEGAIWKAKDLEEALRAMLDAFIPTPPDATASQVLALQKATLILNEIDAIGQ